MGEVKLSDRVRPNSEAAPWVCDEIARIEAERDDLKDVLLRGGWVKCDIATCNCGSWHHRYGLPQRWSEVKDALEHAGHGLTNDNGNLVLNALGELVAERDALRKDFEAALEECKLLTHKVITCGVAASHPDASLAHTGAYKEKWDSPQAEEVRKLRAERDALAAEKADCEKFLKEGERLDECLERWRADALAVLELLTQEKVKSESLAAEVAQADAEYQDAITLAQMNKDRLDAALAEVAKLRAENNVLRNLPSRNPGKSVYPEMVALRAEVAQTGSYCQTLTDAKVELAAELGEAMAEVAKLRDDAALHDETLEICNKQFASLRAEVERLSAACAAKDAALRGLVEAVEADTRVKRGDYYHERKTARVALSDTAGRNYIDATGAVDATVRLWSISPSCYGQGVNVAVPDDWAGAPVKIVRVKP